MLEHVAIASVAYRDGLLTKPKPHTGLHFLTHFISVLSLGSCNPCSICRVLPHHPRRNALPLNAPMLKPPFPSPPVVSGSSAAYTAARVGIVENMHRHVDGQRTGSALLIVSVVFSFLALVSSIWWRSYLTKKVRSPKMHWSPLQTCYRGRRAVAAASGSSGWGREPVVAPTSWCVPRGLGGSGRGVHVDSRT